MTDALTQPAFNPTAAASSSEEKLRLLVNTGVLLASEQSLDTIAQSALDAGLHLCDASYGVFFHANSTIGTHNLIKVSGDNLPHDASKNITSLVDLTQHFTNTQHRYGFVRLDDCTQHAPLRFTNLPPTRSHLALPVRHRDGKLVGTIIYGHPEPNIFKESCEDLLASVATLLARAIENLQLSAAQGKTDTKAQEDILRESEKLAATGRLAATIAHEINNPLEAITNLIYLSRTDPDVPDHVKDLLQTADSELARVSKIAQQTLGFYRDTSRPVSINTSAMLLSIAELFTGKMRIKQLTCTVDLERDFTIVGLQGEIRQVFSNLIVNAIDASSHSAVHIRSRKICQNGIKGISVIVQDHGSGIPAPVRDQLFSAFVTTKQSSGTGLGLWVTRGIVEKQGGTITFRSCTEDPIGNPSGTLFRVFLPANPPQFSATTKTSAK